MHKGPSHISTDAVEEPRWAEITAAALRKRAYEIERLAENAFVEVYELLCGKRAHAALQNLKLVRDLVHRDGLQRVKQAKIVRLHDSYCDYLLLPLALYFVHT